MTVDFWIIKTAS